MTTGQPGGPNLSWLDEELRREKTIVEELRDVIDKQQVVLVDQAQRIISLEDRLTKLQNQLQAIPEIQQSVQNTRDQMAVMIGELRQELRKRETDLLRSRQAEREKDSKVVQEIRMELERIAPLEQAVTVVQAEDRRISEGLMRLQQDLDSLSKFVPQSEEGRRQLADAISKNTVEIKQVVGELEDLYKVGPGLSQRIASLESATTKLAQQVADVQNMRQEVTAQQQELLERERRSDRARTQTLTEWGRQLDGFSHQMDAWADQLRFFADQHEKNRNVLRDVQTLAQDISQQQDRLQQLQRIAEEQLRRDIREARTENDQHWAQDLERRDQLRVEQDQRDEAQEQRLLQLEGDHQDRVKDIKDINGRLQVLQNALEAETQEIHALQRRALKTTTKEIRELLGTLGEMFDAQE